jgi:hypothetical protein
MGRSSKGQEKKTTLNIGYKQCSIYGKWVSFVSNEKSESGEE